MNEKKQPELHLEELDKEALIRLVLQQQAVIFELQAGIQRLKEQLAQNSRNSHQPPGSDGLKKPKVKSLREKGKRRSGGQVGHEGKTLEMVAQPDQIVTHEVADCPHCKRELGAVEVSGVEKRQVFDLPSVPIEVTEHQAEIKVCPDCGERVKADFPAEVVATVQYGKRLQAQLVYLSAYQLLPLERIGQLMADFYGQAVSEGSILASLDQAQAALQPGLEAIREQLVQAEVVHCDETGLRVAGRTQWVHVVSTGDLTWYALHPKRGHQALEDIGLLARCQGCLVHDAWASYFVYQHRQHALCNAHLLRELIFLWEEQQQTWARDLKGWLLDRKHQVEALDLHHAWEPEDLQHFHDQYHAFLTAGWLANPLPETPSRQRTKKSKAQNLLLRLHRHAEAVLAFLYDPGIPFDNNQAERDLRMLKVKQKISGCFRTVTGATQFLAIRSYLSTVRKHGVNPLLAIADALHGQPFIPSPS